MKELYRQEMFLIENVNLSSGKLLLRELAESDWSDVHQYASQDIVSEYQTWGPNTEEESKNYVLKGMEDSSRRPRTRFVLAIIYEEVMVGAVELNIRDISNKVGEISYIISPNYWGNGIATEAGNLLINFGFEEIILHRIFATCDPRNVGSSRVLEKLGMKKEGVIREHLLAKDGWRDSLLYSILEQEWAKCMEDSSIE